jgi:hypothetical protein
MKARFAAIDRQSLGERSFGLVNRAAELSLTRGNAATLLSFFGAIIRASG